MQVELKLSFDLDCDEEKEKMEKINAILSNNEDDEIDWKGGVEWLRDQIDEEVDAAEGKEHKIWQNVKEKFEEMVDDFSMELD